VAAAVSEAAPADSGLAPPDTPERATRFVTTTVEHTAGPTAGRSEQLLSVVTLARTSPADPWLVWHFETEH
jgi:hypothetical protein